MLEASACYGAWRIASLAGNAASDDAVTEHAVR
jgi:hypothetical protein